MFYPDLDAELAEAIKDATPEFASSLKRRFINVGVSAHIRSPKPADPSISINDTHFQENDNQVILSNILCENCPEARIIEATPNLGEKYFKIVADWYNLTLTSSYEMSNGTQLQLLPVMSKGNVQMTIENIKVEGLIGFATYNDALRTTNVDLHFTANNIRVQVEYFDSDNKTSTYSSYEKKNIDDTIVKYLKRDLYWKLQESLRDRLDLVLKDFSLVEIFNENTELAEKYRKREGLLNEYINRVVDRIILKIRHYLVATNYSEISAPYFNTNFSRKFGPITFWGSFFAQDGFVRNLTSLKRTGVFSFASNNTTNDLIIFGAIGFDELELRYNYYKAHIWNIGPSGNIKATIGDNAVKFRVVGRIKNLINMNFDIKDYEVKIEQLENIQVEATGLGYALNWLLSYIATWITGSLKQTIIFELEKNLRSVVDKAILNYLHSNGSIA